MVKGLERWHNGSDVLSSNPGWFVTYIKLNFLGDKKQWIEEHVGHKMEQIIIFLKNAKCWNCRKKFLDPLDMS